MLWLLSVLRSAIFYLIYVSGTLLIALVFFSLVFFTPKRFRHHFYLTWCQFTLVSLKAICGIRWEISGLDNIPEQPVVVLSNHQSGWETFFLYKLLFPVCPILKKELLDIPVWGWALRVQNPIAIDRAKPREASRSILTQGVERIHEGMSIIIFPEGTRTPPGKYKKFSRGGAKLAIAAHSPLLPVAHNAGHYWPAHKFIKHPGTVKVVIGKPLNTTKGDDSELTAVAETWIRQQLTEINSPAM